MMDKEYFLNAEIPWNCLSYNADQSFLDPNSSVDQQYSHFEPSSSASSSALSNEAFFLRELIGKLSGSGNSTTTAAAYYMGANNSTTNEFFNNSTSDSPQKLQSQNVDQTNMANSGNLVPLATPPPSFAGYPATRPAEFSCFGSRRSPFGLKNGELSLGLSMPLMGNGELPRVLSRTFLKQAGPPLENKNFSHSPKEFDKKLSRFSRIDANSNEESSVSEQIPNGETGWKTSTELNYRKRKAVSRGKAKADGSTSAKGAADDEDATAKRSKPTESTKNENGGSNEEMEKQKSDQKKSLELPKDYIHVRARRGQATDSHSLAERVRREKISERMKLLQDLVPGCNKVTGKALMLDEIINYVESLQRQVEFLSMKLASVNPGLDMNTENLLSKNIFQQGANIPQQMYPSNPSSAAVFYNHQTDIYNGPSSHCSMHPITLDVSSDAPLARNLGVQFASVDGFCENLPQFPAFGEDDLHSVVQMSFRQNPVDFPGNYDSK